MKSELSRSSDNFKYQARLERQSRSLFFRRFYPNYISEDTFFNQILAPYLTQEQLILDAGCGSGEISRIDFPPSSTVIGIDRDDEVFENNLVNARAQGDLSFIPLASNTVDLIVCKYVIEHLENPVRTFGEFQRILRPGGYLVVHTPNLHHYVQWFARVIPQRFHSRIIHALCGRPSFIKHHRANTPAGLARLMQTAGFVRDHIEFFESAPDYLQNWGLLYLFGVAYERIVNSTQHLAHWRLNMIGVFHKP